MADLSTAPDLPSTTDLVSAVTHPDDSHSRGDGGDNSGDGGDEDNWKMKWTNDTGRGKWRDLSLHVTWIEFCDGIRVAPEEAKLWYKIGTEAENVLQDEVEFSRMLALVRVSSSRKVVVRKERHDEYCST